MNKVKNLFFGAIAIAILVGTSACGNDALTRKLTENYYYRSY